MDMVYVANKWALPFTDPKLSGWASTNSVLADGLVVSLRILSWIALLVID
jgi:hypothetical protein